MSVVILGSNVMRWTVEAKVERRQRILEAARQLFAASGYEASTTRDIADAAGIANGTLFNYFPNKEAILASLVVGVTSGMHADFESQSLDEGSFEEHLFAFPATALRKLKPWRKHLPLLLESWLNPLTTTGAGAAATLHPSLL